MKKVLLVENDITNVELTKRLLRNICDLYVAYNAIEAIELSKIHKFSLILLDINLGSEYDGIYALNEIRKINDNIQIPVIVITAFAFQQDKEKIMENGINEYLVKPIDFIKFKNTVSGYL